MNTISVAQQLARRSVEKDVTRCDVDQQSAIIEALNGAVEEFYAVAPVQMRKKTFSYLLQAPATIAMTITAGTKATQTFDADQIGCSILLAGDPVRNEVDGLNLLLDAYSGATDDPSATLWYDAYQFPDEIEYLSDEPEVRTADGSGNTASNQVVRLARDESDYSRFMYFGRSLTEFDGVSGIPRRYSIEPRAPFASGNPTEPRTIMRVYPPPAQAFKLRFEAVVKPRTMTIDEIRLGTSTFPVEQRYIRNIIIPIALHLYSSEPYFSEVPAHKLRKIEDDAEKARVSIGAIISDLAPSHNQIGTTFGF